MQASAADSNEQIMNNADSLMNNARATTSAWEATTPCSSRTSASKRLLSSGREAGQEKGKVDGIREKAKDGEETAMNKGKVVTGEAKAKEKGRQKYALNLRIRDHAPSGPTAIIAALGCNRTKPRAPHSGA